MVNIFGVVKGAKSRDFKTDKKKLFL